MVYMHVQLLLAQRECRPHTVIIVVIASCQECRCIDYNLNSSTFIKIIYIVVSCARVRVNENQVSIASSSENVHGKIKQYCFN